MSKRKHTNKENEPDPVEEDEEELPPLRKRVRHPVADGTSLQTASKLTSRTCPQKQILLRIRRGHMIRPLGKLRLRRMIHIMPGMGPRVCLAIWWVLGLLYEHQ